MPGGSACSGEQGVRSMNTWLGAVRHSGGGRVGERRGRRDGGVHIGLMKQLLLMA